MNLMGSFSRHLIILNYNKHGLNRPAYITVGHGLVISGSDFLVTSNDRKTKSDTYW